MNYSWFSKPCSTGFRALVLVVVMVVMIWHFLQGLPLHRRLIHLEGEIQSSEEYSRKESQ